MAKEVIPMDVRLRIAVAADELNVSAFCREHGVSRETLYFWKCRFKAAGVDELEARSRAPKSSPQRIGADLDEALVVSGKVPRVRAGPESSDGLVRGSEGEPARGVTRPRQPVTLMIVVVRRSIGPGGAT
jgi:transposase-like protein